MQRLQNPVLLAIGGLGRYSNQDISSVHWILVSPCLTTNTISHFSESNRTILLLLNHSIRYSLLHYCKSPDISVLLRNISYLIQKNPTHFLVFYPQIPHGHRGIGMTKPLAQDFEPNAEMHPLYVTEGLPHTMGPIVPPHS